MIYVKRQKGAISVFLSLVLVPVIIFSLLTVDAARIYSSKVVISDAGEMAMNAALAQYDEQLFDKYGLFGMSSTPESMESSLSEYFETTLNSSGETDYKQILKLMEENFEAINVSNTEVYQTEVEKQQILEYMKYRAPVCLTELVLEKLNFIKDSKELLNAMNKEIDFAEAMEECQDAFEEALEALNELNSGIEAFSVEGMESELSQTNIDLTTTVARCLLMRAAIQNYSDKPENKTIEEMVKNYIAAAKQVDMNTPDSETSYSQYLDTMYYENGINAAGGIEKIYGDEPDEADSEAHDTWEENKKQYDELNKEYKTCKNNISGYMNNLLNKANGLVKEHHNNLYSYYEQAKSAEQKAETAKKRLEEVKETLLNAQNEYNRWDQATQNLSTEIAGDMPQQVEEYRSFFGDDMESLNELLSKVEIDKDYFAEVKEILTNEKMYEKSIALIDSDSQMNAYTSNAKNAVSGQEKYYESLEAIRQNTFVANYHHISKISTSNVMYHIKEDAFYIRLQQFCKKTETNESKAETEKGNSNLNEGSEAAEEAEQDSDYPEFDWSTASQTLPTSALGLSKFQSADKNLTGLSDSSDVSNKSSRKNVIAKMKDSINSASSFLDGVDRIISDNVENLYIAEYAMQMFSYYTCDKQMNEDKSLETLDEKKNLSISGYQLSDNKAYKGEVEYILWGNASSKENIKSTMMLLFGVRLLFNSIYAFTDSYINSMITTSANAISSSAPYLQPIIKIALKFGVAAVETSIDVGKLKEGYGVAILKDEDSFETMDRLGRADVRNGVTFDYGEWLRVFLNMQMLAGMEDNVLARIADCVQINTNTDITKAYTMIEIQADVGVQTTFMRKIADWSSSEWGYDNSYTITYKGILGY